MNNNSKLNSLVEEANKLWTFFQKFIDEHSVDRIARYAEFVTPD